MKPFTTDWWLEVADIAYSIARNLPWETHYTEVGDYCKNRAENLNLYVY